MHCFARGVLISVENPANSWFWLVSGMIKAHHVPALSTYLRHCMFGSARKKHTKLLHLIPQLTLLGILCDGKRERQPWGKLSSVGALPSFRALQTKSFGLQGRPNSFR